MQLAKHEKPEGCQAAAVDYRGPLTVTAPEGHAVVEGDVISLICGDRQTDLLGIVESQAKKRIAIEALGGFCVNCPNRKLQDAEAESRYNPKRVSWTTDRAPGEQVAVITRDHLRAFSKQRIDSTSLGERLWNALTRPHEWDKEALFAYMHLSEDREEAIGLRADRAHALLEALQNDSLMPRNIGPVSIELLAEYCAELVVEERDTR